MTAISGTADREQRSASKTLPRPHSKDCVGPLGCRGVGWKTCARAAPAGAYRTAPPPVLRSVPLPHPHRWSRATATAPPACPPVCRSIFLSFAEGAGCGGRGARLVTGSVHQNSLRSSASGGGCRQHDGVRAFAGQSSAGSALAVRLGP